MASATAGVVVLAGVTIAVTRDAPSSSQSLQQAPPARLAEPVPPGPIPPSPPPFATPAPADDTETAERAQEAAQAVVAGAQLSIAVFDRETDLAVTEKDVERQVPCMSVVKLFIALDVIERSPGGMPDPATVGRLHEMLENSDDDIASRFWTTNGGPAIIARTAERLGLANTEVPADDPGQWGDVLTTPQDLTTTYRHITERLSPQARDFVLDALGHASRMVEGFNQHFGIPEGVDDRPWAVKQGWGTSGSRAVMNTTGTVGPDSRYVVVVMATAGSYTSLPRAVTAAVRTLSPALDG